VAVFIFDILEVKGKMIMSLTAEEEREMYADIKVIKNDLSSLIKKLEKHDERILQLEIDVQTLQNDKKWVSWICGAVGALTSVIVSGLIKLLKEIL
jgi:hypothetical protein